MPGPTMHGMDTATNEWARRKITALVVKLAALAMRGEVL
jgi:hypothetical protein